MNSLNIEIINIALTAGFDGEIGRKSNGGYELVIVHEDESQLDDILSAYENFADVLVYDEDFVKVTLD